MVEKLVKMFYVNLSYKYDIVNSEVKEHPITTCLEDFAQVCNQTFMDQDYDQLVLKGNEFNYEIHAHSLLSDPFYGITYPFNVGLNHLNSRLIYYTLNYVLFPRKGN